MIYVIVIVITMIYNHYNNDYPLSLQTHLSITHAHYATNKWSFIFFLLSYKLIHLSFIFLQTYLPITHAHHTSTKQCLIFFLKKKNFPVNLFTYNLFSCKPIYPSSMLIYVITKQSFIFLLSSPLVRMMVEPSRTWQKASPRLQQPQTKEIRKLCLLMWFSL